MYRWRFGEVEFDETKWEFRLSGRSLPVEPRPLEVLCVLLRKAGSVVTKEDFQEAAWSGSEPGDKALTNAIGKLRVAMCDRDQSIIETVHKIGYRLVAPVSYELVQPASPPAHG